MKKKPLEEMLIELAGEPDVDMSTRNWALFLDRWEETKSAYAKGWSYKDIWRILHRNSQFTFEYNTFISYVRKMKRRELLIEEEKNKARQKASPFSRRMAHEGGEDGNPSPTKLDLPIYGTKRKPGAPGIF